VWPIGVKSNFALTINWCAVCGTSLASLPVLLAENAAVGLYNIHGQVENHASLCVCFHVDVGQAVQAKDVALLPVLVDFGESQLSCKLGLCVFT